MTHTAAIKHSFQQMSPSLPLSDSVSKVWVSVCAYIHCLCNGACSCHQFLQGSVFVCVWGCLCECVYVFVCVGVEGSVRRRGCDRDSDWQLKPGHWRVSIHLLVYVSFYLPLSPMPWPQQWAVGWHCLSAGSTSGCKHCVCIAVCVCVCVCVCACASVC